MLHMNYIYNELPHSDLGLSVRAHPFKNVFESFHVQTSLKLQLHGAIYRLRFYSNSLIHILSLSNSHNNVASIQKNQGDKSHRVIVALGN